jgi:hypothetical protein
MIKIGGRTKVFKIFRGMRARPDTFEKTLREFKFPQERSEPRARRLSTKDFRLERCMFVEKMRQSRVVAFNQIIQTRRRMRDKTRRNDVTTESSHTD